MPKSNVKLGAFADIEPSEGFVDYTGPVPPAGLYSCVVKWMKLINNSNGDPMFKAIFEIAEPKGSPKSNYNGYAIWHNANVTRVGAPYLNNMLDALGLDRSGDIIISDEKVDRVVRIGRKKVDGLRVLVNTLREEYPEDSDNWKLAARSFASAGVSTEKDSGGEADDVTDADGSDVEPDVWASEGESIDAF